MVFTLHEIKHRKFFWGHSVYIYIYIVEHTSSPEDRVNVKLRVAT